jgi:hypothetical protein
MQTHGVSVSGSQAGNRIGRGPLPRRLVDCRRSSGGSNRGRYGDGVCYRVSAAAGVVFVGNKGIVAAACIAHRRTAGIDGYTWSGYRQCGTSCLCRSRRVTFRIRSFHHVIVGCGGREAGVGVTRPRHRVGKQVAGARSKPAGCAAVDAVGTDRAVSRWSYRRPTHTDRALRKSPSPSDPWALKELRCNYRCLGVSLCLLVARPPTHHTSQEFQPGNSRWWKPRGQCQCRWCR